MHWISTQEEDSRSNPGGRDWPVPWGSTSTLGTQNTPALSTTPARAMCCSLELGRFDTFLFVKE
jgi:hypothetical protein